MKKKNAPATKGNESAPNSADYTRPLNLPCYGTQPARMLAALLHGSRIDPLTGWRRLGIYRLSDTVFQLRRAGWNVTTARKDVTNRFGEPCHVAIYSLPSEEIQRAGERGRAFAEHALRNSEVAA